MNNFDLGRVHAFLLRHRCIETKPFRRNVSKEEREIATILRDADQHMYGLLEEILDGQGLKLRAFSDFDVKGIAKGSTVFILMRKSDSAPPFFGTDRLVEKIRQSVSIKSDTEAKIWFTQLWFILLDLLYTRKNRSPYSLQEWIDARFTKAIFVDSVLNYINDDIRKIDQNTLKSTIVFNTLTKLNDGVVTTVCNRFLKLMVDAGLIEEIEKDIYRQSLLFACEISDNYERQLKPILQTGIPFDAASTVLISEDENINEENNGSDNTN